MVIIQSRLPVKSLPIYKSLSQLIQGFIYHQLPPDEHVGFKHSSGKVFKRMNFDFWLKDERLQIRFTSFVPKYEELIALGALKQEFCLGEIHLSDTTVSIEQHRVESECLHVKGYVACALKGLLGHKIYLEPQDSRHLEMMRVNILERYETLVSKKYEDELEINLKWQSLGNPKLFYFGNNNRPLKSWQARWEISAKKELINLLLDVGAGSGCMSAGVGFLEVVK